MSDAGHRLLTAAREMAAFVTPPNQGSATMDDPVEGDQLKSIVERIERLEEEKKTISDDIGEVYSEAKGNGYDTKVLRKVIAIRKRDRNERAEEEAILDLYLQAVGDEA